MQTVIIGAGILGASTAFHLSRAGHKVVVIDAALEGRATVAGAGIICPWVSGIQDPAFFRLYTAGAEYYPEFVAALAEAGESDLGYRQAGAMLVSEDPDDLTRMERNALARRATSPAMGEVTRLTPAQAQALFPPMNSNLGAIHIAGGARVDGRLLAAALLRAAERLGATILHGHAEPRQTAGRVTGVDLAGERIAADRVIVTAGAWANSLLRPLGLGLPVAPQRGQIVHLRLPVDDSAGWPVILPAGSHYIVPFGDGRIVAGATRETGSGFDYRVTAAGQMEVLSEALRIAPGLAAATVVETRVGFRPLGGAVRPLVGWMPGISGLAVANGLGSSGLTIGPLAGRLLADLVMEQPSPLDLAPFDPARWEAAGTEPPAAH